MLFQVNRNLVESLKLQIAKKTHEQFVKEYLSDSTQIPLREKPLKAKKELKPKKNKRGRPKKVHNPTTVTNNDYIEGDALFGINQLRLRCWSKTKLQR